MNITIEKATTLENLKLAESMFRDNANQLRGIPRKNEESLQALINIWEARADSIAALIIQIEGDAESDEESERQSAA